MLYPNGSTVFTGTAMLSASADAASIENQLKQGHSFEVGWLAAANHNMAVESSAPRASSQQRRYVPIYYCMSHTYLLFASALRSTACTDRVTSVSS